ncbi:uncharacterized protein LOC132256028 [Phlebotomus argentipes]|uniref:uncharacterized protein LOC132256028 n=1 Tax=Phlebotomus argentipes TaxID=94469 RepID=UPI002893398E|nr:uncharacterized protein LOC132256028 [Phlebotomus argentipes]
MTRGTIILLHFIDIIPGAIFATICGRMKCSTKGRNRGNQSKQTIVVFESVIESFVSSSFHLFLFLPIHIARRSLEPSPDATRGAFSSHPSVRVSSAALVLWGILSQSVCAMVNKQYNVQNKTGKQPKNYSPPPKRDLSAISTVPNIVDSDTEPQSLPNEYFRNITDNYSQCASEKDPDSCDRVSAKELSIGDIGRFQYILQMDKEMGSHPDSLYRIPTRPTNSSSTSSSNSIGSNLHNIGFWKATGSQTPIASTSSSRRRWSDIERVFSKCWQYIKWPLALVFICAVLGVVVYFIVVESEINSNLVGSENHVVSLDTSIESDLTVDFNDLDKLNDDARVERPRVINGHANAYNVSGATLNQTDELLEVIKGPDLANRLNDDSEVFAIFVKKPSSTTEQSSTENSTNDSVTPTTIRQTASSTTTEAARSAVKFNVPTRESLQQYGFTSGHQNNFGIPIEEDERILSLLNAELIKSQNGSSSLFSTTDSSVYRTRVSPTLPIISRVDHTTEGLKSNGSDDGICKSTSLPLCRGVLPYDLTSLNRKALSQVEIDHLHYLIEAQCSIRAAEFVCTILEPECRPAKMGNPLQPCKRICKSILEACSHVIASSEILTTMFDCDSYPDSLDRNVCEDPTRRGKCYKNEFKCLDSTCIPLQWKCDNIKDCAEGDDEENCKFCETNEFRCVSNEKCIPDKWRCDRYKDCPDSSDELDCEEEEDARSFPLSYGNARVYPFVHEQSPSNPNSRPYLTISGDDRLNAGEASKPADGEKDIYAFSDDDHFERSVPSVTLPPEDAKAHRESDNDEIQSEAASGRAVLFSKSLANFQDSKEIMMTSDSEADYKYSSTDRVTLRTAHISPCPEGELRCISGRCISVNQLCDKITDCPDGADEAMCVYKN